MFHSFRERALSAWSSFEEITVLFPKWVVSFLVPEWLTTEIIESLGTKSFFEIHFQQIFQFQIAIHKFS